MLAMSGCADDPPLGPSPAPSPLRVTITGAITDTVSGSTVGSFTHDVDRLPARLEIAHPAYVTRSAWITGIQPTVDLFPEAGFDLAFYRQLARGTLDGRMDPLRIRSSSPAIYLQRTGLSDAMVASLERVARETVSALTGGRLSVTQWETGTEARAPTPGWIAVELYHDPAGECGRATIGGGDVRLNTDSGCRLVRSFAHELGHALGFWHVADAAMLMHAPSGTDQPTARERYHAALAYARAQGNTDIDVDFGGSASMAVVVAD